MIKQLARSLAVTGMAVLLATPLQVLAAPIADKAEENEPLTSISSQERNEAPNTTLEESEAQKPQPAGAPETETKAQEQIPDSQPVEHNTAFQTAPPAPIVQPQQQQAAEQVRQVLVPADTVLYIKLDNTISTKESDLNEPVSATVTEPVYLGPYLLIPAQSRINGAITDINRKADEQGRHPYLVVTFNALRRPSDEGNVPFSAKLIAYKNGMRGEDYLWRLPEKDQRKQKNIMGVVGGAAAGAMFNPIFGTLIGAGIGLLRNTLPDRIARSGFAEVEAGKDIPLAVDREFQLTIADPSVSPEAATHREAVFMKAPPMKTESRLPQPVWPKSQEQKP